MKARTLYSRVSIEADIDSLEDSRQATAAVLRALRDRLTPEEATQAVAQLPQELKRLWASGRPAVVLRVECEDPETCKTLIH